MAIESIARTDQRRWRRPLGVVAAVLAPTALWIVSEFGLGMHLQTPAGTLAPVAMPLMILPVIVITAVLSLIGWGVLAALERFTARARSIWLVVALVALAASLALPLAGSGVDGADRIVMELMHLAAGAILITTLYRSSVPSAVRRGRQTSAPVTGSSIAS